MNQFFQMLKKDHEEVKGLGHRTAFSVQPRLAPQCG